LGSILLDACVPTHVAEDSASRAILLAKPVVGTQEVSVVIVRRPSGSDEPGPAALEAELAHARRLRSDHVLPLLLDGALNGSRYVLVTPANGAVSLAERLATRPPSTIDVLAALADVARGLADIHRQGRGFGPLAPEHVLLIPGPDGHERGALPPVWWAWRHGFDADAAAPWGCASAGGHPSARDAWALAAISWHALTGAPPDAVRPDAVLRTSLPASAPPALRELLDPLLAAPASESPIDLLRFADVLERVAHQISGGQGPAIAPPMLLGTPVPIGGQLRTRPSPLAVPPPLATAPMAPRPRVGLGPTPPPPKPPRPTEEPLLSDAELSAAASRWAPVPTPAGLTAGNAALLALAAVLLVIVAVLALYVAELLG
jgi:hypothetical protein